METNKAMQSLNEQTRQKTQVSEITTTTDLHFDTIAARAIRMTTLRSVAQQSEVHLNSSLPLSLLLFCQLGGGTAGNVNRAEVVTRVGVQPAPVAAIAVGAKVDLAHAAVVPVSCVDVEMAALAVGREFGRVGVVQVV